MPYVVTNAVSTANDTWTGWTCTGTSVTTSSIVWNNWTTSAETTATNGTIWRAWTTSTSTNVTATVSNSVVWSSWVGTDGQQRGVVVGAQPDPRSERRWKQAVLRDRIKRRLQREKQRRTAEAMLRDVLSPEQWRDWQAYRSVRVRGKRGLFEINPASRGELYLLAADGKKLERKFCVHASTAFCVEDRVLALVLALQADEDEVMKRANHPAFTVDEARRVVARRHRHVDHELEYVNQN